MNRWSSTLAQAHHSYNFDWTYEVKLDGYRAIGVRTSRNTILYCTSRNHKTFNKRFARIAEALGHLPADTVIDGEYSPG
jgi:bifunctional non-homologous end joining protein LigD